MAQHTITATLESKRIPAAALSTILSQSEANRWNPNVEYYPGPGSELTFEVNAESIDGLAATLRAIVETIENAELSNR